MDRRDFLKTTSAAAAAATLASTEAASAGADLPAPALSRGVTDLRLATPWPEGSAAFGDSAERLARRIEAATDGRLRITLTPAHHGGLEAVMLGEADLYHGVEHHHLSFEPALAYFAGLPYFCGLEPLDHAAWLAIGGGQALWDEVGAELGVKPLLAGHSGRAPGLWSRAEINTIADLAGQQIHVQGLARDVVRSLGAEPAQLAAREIVPALADGRLFAAEWGAMLASLSLGIPEAARHHIGLGINNAGSALSLGVRRSLWDSLSSAEQTAIEACAAQEYGLSLAEARAHETILRDMLRDSRGIKLDALPGDLMAALSQAADAAVARNAGASRMASRVHHSYMAFRQAVSGLEPIAELHSQQPAV